jgi:hypothetical protein
MAVSNCATVENVRRRVGRVSDRRAQGPGAVNLPRVSDILPVRTGFRSRGKLHANGRKVRVRNAKSRGNEKSGRRLLQQLVGCKDRDPSRTHFFPIFLIFLTPKRRREWTLTLLTR